MPLTPQDLVARLIMTTVESRGNLTRTQLQFITGLPKSTVTEHVRALLRQRLLREFTSDATGSRGRPARALCVEDPGFMRGVVVLSHGAGLVTGSVRVAFENSRGIICWNRTSDGGGDPVGTAVGLVQDGLAELGGPDVAEILLVLPLPVIRQHESGSGLPQLQVLPSMATLIGATPQNRLTAKLGIPVAIANDADVAALGEARFGTGSGIADLVYVTMQHGVGMGIVIGGNLVEPTGVPVGELAHLRRAGSDARCLCSSVGCWLTGVSDGLGLISMVRKTGVTVSSWGELQSRCAAGDPSVLAALSEAGAHIGAAFAQFATLSGRFTVLLEKELAAAFEPVALGLASALAGSAPDWRCSGTPVRKGLLGRDAEIRGGFEYLRVHRAAGPAPLVGANGMK